MKQQRLQELGLTRLDVLCAYLYYQLHQKSLHNAPVILAGYRSIWESAALQGHRPALEKLRSLCRGLNTQAALRAAAARYNDRGEPGAAGQVRHFRINERTLVIEPIFDLPSESMGIVLRELREGTQRSEHERTLARLDKPMFVRVSFEGERRRYEVKGLPTALPAPAAHQLAAPRMRDIEVRWSDLLDQARAMDDIDKREQVARPGNWHERLRCCQLAALQGNGDLTESETLKLSRLHHLIGLPGSGKTTLLACLLRYMDAQGLRTVAFFPSIEVSRQYLETLKRYGVAVGLLMGTSTQSRHQHGRRVGETIAAGDPLRGFARTSTSAGLFEGVCALPALTDAPAEAFDLDSRYCTSVLQDNGRGKLVDHLCPAWSVCSANRAARQLPEARIWLGHVRSSDTRVPPHSTLFNERHFDLIARNFDLVIFDEADKAQQDLDMTGLAQLQLSGYASSFHWDIQTHTLQQLASGNNARLRNLDFAQLATDSAEFEKLNVALISAIQRLTDDLKVELSGLLLTPLRLIGDWISPRRLSPLADDADADPLARMKDALCTLWESAAIAAFQTRSGYEPAETNGASDEWRRMSEALVRPVAQLQQERSDLQNNLARWLNAPTLRMRSDAEKELSEQLQQFARHLEAPRLRLLVQLLLPVTFTVLMYRRLAARVTVMAHDGLVPAIKVDERCSDELLDRTPDNLLGSLSGVRFHSRATDQPGWDSRHIQLQYIIFSGAPRALMYQMHEWQTDSAGLRVGPAVLLASATSFMPESPSSHISVMPQYVLRRVEGPEQLRSRYAFRPIADPENPELALRFSGERSETVRLRNLEKMVHALLDGGPSDSILSKDCGSFDVQQGVARKAAFIVNSYDQCLALKRYIDQKLPSWRGRVIAVVNESPAGMAAADYVTAAAAETLGDRGGWDILIFPMGALGRGTNIVFSSGPRVRDATLGTLYFLTRPHPSPEDLSFLVSLAAQASQSFNAKEMLTTSIPQLTADFAAARRSAYGRVGRLLRHPLYAKGLGEMFEPFTANMAVPLMQTIGRATRNGRPAQCIFVDRAWAEKSAQGLPDTARTSMLVQLHDLLRRGLESPDRRVATLHRELYAGYYTALSDVDGLIFERTQVDEVSAADEALEPPLWRLDEPDTHAEGLDNE
jgi:hypothetical protein